MSGIPVTMDAPPTPTPQTTLRSRFTSATRLLGPRFWVALTLVLAVLFFAFIGPYLWGKGDPKATVGSLYEEPSRELWLGTDNFGRDVFTQLMHGTRSSLIIGAIAGAIATFIGVAIGLASGYFGGIIDEALMGFTNVVITIPTIVVLILLSVAIGTKSIFTMAVIIGITSWPWTARAVRAQASSVRTREHVDLARLSGASTFSLMIWEVLPYMFSYIFMAFVLQMTSGILQEASLSMLGLGPSSAISLGIMLHWSLLWESVRTGAWWAFIPPTFMLTLIAFSLFLLQSSLDEVFNPRLRGR